MMNGCEIQSQALGKLGVFLGIESADWHLEEVYQAALFLKDHGVDSLYVKLADGTNMYYGGVDGWDLVYQEVVRAGLKFIPYTYMYGDKFGSLQQEINIGLSVLYKYTLWLADLETEWDGKPEWARLLHDRVKPMPGAFYVSTWANPDEHGWMENITILRDSVNGWMPQYYTSYLADRANPFPSLVNCVYPVVSYNYLDALKKYKDASTVILWEFQSCIGDPGKLDELVTLVKGTHIVDLQKKLPLTASGEVARLVTPSQFEKGETQSACGFYSAASLKYMRGPTDNGPLASAELIDTTADAWYDLKYTTHGIDQMGGVWADDMHTMIIAGGNHYQDLLTIQSGSQQASDIAQVEGALKQGYPVAILVSEDSVFDAGDGKNPYWWGAAGLHIMVVTGIGSKGWLIHDTANISGSLDGDNTINPQPQEYDKQRINVSWAAAVQGSWLPALPSSWDPTQTVINPPPQSAGGAIGVSAMDLTLKQVTPGDAQKKQASDIWNAIATSTPGKQPAPNYNTGIALAWAQTVYNGKGIGVPLTGEYDTVDWNNQPIKRQDFSCGHVEWNKGQPRIFAGPLGEMHIS